ncbi:unnamed protein product [Ilex paraguariensis]|uniref:Uncharacterized protein n=1 Tax=Ilex paraguariensis TaxID=185542 RepID=A0ABC8QQX5_9AQUA
MLVGSVFVAEMVLVAALSLCVLAWKNSKSSILVVHAVQRCCKSVSALILIIGMLGEGYAFGGAAADSTGQ